MQFKKKNFLHIVCIQISLKSSSCLFTYSLPPPPPSPTHKECRVSHPALLYSINKTAIRMFLAVGQLSPTQPVIPAPLTNCKGATPHTPLYQINMSRKHHLFYPPPDNEGKISYFPSNNPNSGGVFEKHTLVQAFAAPLYRYSSLFRQFACSLCKK